MVNLRVAIIGTVGLPARYGGFETLAQNLVDYLSCSHSLTVYCSSKVYGSIQSEYAGAKLRYIPLQANGIQSVAYDLIGMLRSLRGFDVLLVLGVSGCVFLPIIRFFSRAKIIVNVDGLEWKRDKWSGFSADFLKFSEGVAARFSDIVVADNKIIQDYIMSAYGVAAELIPYGGDHASRLPMTKNILEVFPFLSSPYAFSVCRIEPENNIHIILEALSQQNSFQMVFVGNWQSSDYGRNLVIKYKNCSNLHLLNPIYDQDILDGIRSNCKIYLHGHSAGGTNPSLVEAMCLQLPILAYDVGYNRETTENSALYFSDATDLLDIFSRLNSFDLSQMANKLYEIAMRRYCWQKIAENYSSLFNRIA